MIRTALTLCALFCATPVFAQGTQVAFGPQPQDTSLPVEVTAERLFVSENDATALFTGDVVIGQGEMRLFAPRVLVFYSDDQTGIERLEATGGVTLINGDQEAESETANYEVNRGTIEMLGNVLLTQRANTLVSDRMDVDLETGTALMNGRVRTVLQTDQN